MISFLVTKIKWNDKNIGVQGDLCVNGNPVVPGQVLTINKTELERDSFNDLVISKAKPIADKIPQFAFNVISGLDEIPIDIAISGKRQIQEPEPLAQPVKQTFIEKLRGKVRL